MSDSDSFDLVIVGAGPCGLACAVSAMRAGMAVVVIESRVVASTIFEYPTYVHFFSTAEKLGIGGLPFIVAEAKPTRRDGLAYYRGAVRHFGIPVRQYERVTAIEGVRGAFVVRSDVRGRRRETRAAGVVVATGYFGSPNKLDVAGEELPHVAHVFREGHVAFEQDVVVVGGGNSAAEAALELFRAGGRVTLVHFGPTFDKRIKPWILPDLENRIKEGSIAVRWNSRVQRIDGDSVAILTQPPDALRCEEQLAAQLVFVMTGFAPNTDLLRAAGVPIDATTGIPAHDPETLETTVPGIFIAGVVVAGYDANKVFIENGRFHGDKIVASLLGKAAPPPPKLSLELDT